MEKPKILRLLKLKLNRLRVLIARRLHPAPHSLWHLHPRGVYCPEQNSASAFAELGCLGE
jgi:hypothetical protein